MKIHVNSITCYELLHVLECMAYDLGVNGCTTYFHLIDSLDLFRSSLWNSKFKRRLPFEENWKSSHVLLHYTWLQPFKCTLLVFNSLYCLSHFSHLIFHFQVVCGRRNYTHSSSPLPSSIYLQGNARIRRTFQLINCGFLWVVYDLMNLLCTFFASWSVTESS